MNLEFRCFPYLKLHAISKRLFFEIGGHSLLATQAVSNLKEAFRIEIPLHDLFMFHTVQQLAEQIDQLLDNKNQEMQNDSKENVSLQDYVQKEAEVSNEWPPISKNES
ncbi:phosphopantetheine-binding protein [Bacillus cereus]|uniref:phosphopantetheine-binding protein n=1 Tax=Bacillus cereus TaxID=1396 RepID=UPI003AFF9357